MIRIAICDDDRQYASDLGKEVFGLFEGGADVRLYTSGEDLLEDAELLHELVFLDVELPGADGIETALRLRRTNRNAVLIFISGVRYPTPETFKVAPYRYLLKQYDRKGMVKELCEIVEETKKTFHAAFLPCMRGGSAIAVKLIDILYISITRRGCEVHVFEGGYGEEEGRILIGEKLRELYRRLKTSDFAYAHNSYIVNLRNVEKFTRKELTLKDKTKLSVSRSRSAEFEGRMFEYWGRKYQ